jgi:hypothetical protein
MSKFDEFKARFPGRLDKSTEEELRLFFDSVEDLSDDYDHWVARLRAQENSNRFSKASVPTRAIQI